MLSLRVKPNSSQEGMGEVKNDFLTIRLNAPAVEGKANDALIRFLSRRLDVAKSRITIIHGEKGRNKVVAIKGLGPDEVAALLGVTQ